METGTKSLITSFVLAITILLTLTIWSCGKRITTTQRHEINKDSISINNSIELTQNASWSNIGSIKPFDPLKPMIIDGKQYFNVTFEFGNTAQSELNIKTTDNLSYEGSEAASAEKKTEKTDYSNLWIGLSLVIGTLFVLYLTLTKYKIL